MPDSPFPDFYHTTFHAPWYVFERWGSIFDVKAYIPRGDLDYQDLLLLKRREERVGVVRPLRMSVLERNLSSVINSRSWRMTAPLRRLMSRLRGN